MYNVCITSCNVFLPPSYPVSGISDESQWYPTKINDILWKSMISDGNQWYPMKIIDIRRKSLISDENQWYPTKIIDIQWKSMISDGNHWYPVRINDILWKSMMKIYDHRWFSMIIDDGTPWWKYWFGVDQGSSWGWFRVDQGSSWGPFGVNQGVILNVFPTSGGSFHDRFLSFLSFFIFQFCIFPNHRHTNSNVLGEFKPPWLSI